jgi:ABC-2 type transport system ATP-binding protein
VADILGGTGTPQVRVRVSGPGQAEDVLSTAGLRVTRDGEHLVVAGAEDPAEITRVLAGHGLYVSELTPIRPDLESAFLSLTADEGLGTEADRQSPGSATEGAA